MRGFRKKLLGFIHDLFVPFVFSMMHIICNSFPKLIAYYEITLTLGIYISRFMQPLQVNFSPVLQERKPELTSEIMAFRDYLLSSTISDTLDVWELKGIFQSLFSPC